MKSVVIFFTILSILGIFSTGYAFRMLQEPSQSHFYDGEGNEIPTHAVNLLVHAQFVIMNKSEQDTLTKYFPVWE